MHFKASFNHFAAVQCCKMALQQFTMFVLINLTSCYLLLLLFINDIYPGSSTHSKVAFREVMYPIELE